MGGGSEFMAAGERLCGVVLDVRGRYARLLVEGNFVRLPAAEGWRAGDEVWLLPDQLAAPASRGPWGRARLRWTAIAALTALAAGTASLGFVEVAAAQQVAAVVSIDINPSVDLYVNKAGMVVRTTSFDHGGERILEQTHVRGTPIAQAIPALVSQATRDGYLTSTNLPPVASTTTPFRSSSATASSLTDGGKASEHTVLVVVAQTHTAPSSLPTALSGAVDQGLAQTRSLLQKDDVDASLEAAQAPTADVRGAAQDHLSLGRYAVGQALAASGRGVSVTDLQSATLGALLQSGVASGAASKGKGQSSVRSSSSSSPDVGKSSSSSSTSPPTRTPNGTGQTAGSMPVLPSVNQLVHLINAQAATAIPTSSSHGPHSSTSGRSTASTASTVGKGEQSNSGRGSHPTGTEPPTGGIGLQVGGSIFSSLATKTSSERTSPPAVNEASSSTSSHYSAGGSAGAGSGRSVGQSGLRDATVGKPPGPGSNTATTGHSPSASPKSVGLPLRLGPAQSAGATHDASSSSRGSRANHAGGGVAANKGGS